MPFLEGPDLGVKFMFERTKAEDVKALKCMSAVGGITKDDHAVFLALANQVQSIISRL